MQREGNLQIRTVDINAKKPLTSILESIPNFMEHYDSLIDAGAYLKGVDNEQVVEQLSKCKKTGKKKAVVHVTTDNEKVIQTLGREDAQPLQNRKDIKMSERITYYDQAHRIGTDIAHEQTARAAAQSMRKCT